MTVMITAFRWKGLECSAEIENHAKTRVSGHHSFVRLGRLGERHALDHRCDLVVEAECEVVFIVDCRACEAADDGAAAEDQVRGLYWYRVGAAPTTTKRPRGLSPATKPAIDWPLLAVATTAAAPPNRVSPAATSSVALSM